MQYGGKAAWVVWKYIPRYKYLVFEKSFSIRVQNRVFSDPDLKPRHKEPCLHPAPRPEVQCWRSGILAGGTVGSAQDSTSTFTFNIELRGGGRELQQH